MTAAACLFVRAVIAGARHARWNPGGAEPKRMRPQLCQESHKKLLCITFDMALFSSYLGMGFIHFVYHDGVFESLDDRKKVKLFDEIRAKCEAGLQQIITLIDSDLPVDAGGHRLAIPSTEIIRLLHDEGANGRLFRMEQW